jgi:hypothetical protein
VFAVKPGVIAGSDQTMIKRADELLVFAGIADEDLNLSHLLF